MREFVVSACTLKTARFKNRSAGVVVRRVRYRAVDGIQYYNNGLAQESGGAGSGRRSGALGYWVYYHRLVSRANEICNRFLRNFSPPLFHSRRLQNAMVTDRPWNNVAHTPGSNRHDCREGGSGNYTMYTRRTTLVRLHTTIILRLLLSLFIIIYSYARNTGFCTTVRCNHTYTTRLTIIHVSRQQNSVGSWYLHNGYLHN